MKKIVLLLFMFFRCFTMVQANAPGDSTGSPIPDSSGVTAAQAANTQTASVQKKAAQTAPGNTKTVAGIDRIVVDSSALYNAQNYPKKYLYSNYLFDKNYKCGIKWFHAIAAFILLLLLWIAGIKYAAHDGLCKDACFNKDGTPIDPVKCPFSYARTQLFWWTMVILTCYIFFYGITGVLLPLNATSALLMGFGAIVYGFGKIIDSRQIQENKGKRNQDIGAQNTNPDFIKDILSDDNGISIHRFQAVLFNLIFGVGFIAYFIKALMAYKYPLADFNDWQFALMGISSTAYLGMKATENNQDAITKTDMEAVG
jgi:hypothetical protein